MADLDVDVEVRLPSGRWSATFVTLQRLDSLMRLHAETGEAAGGLYEWCADMIVVRDVSDDVIRRTVEHLIQEGDLEGAFGHLGE